MRLDLTQQDLFKEDELVFDKTISFIFGKNGTGKTTISDLIKEQKQESDVCVFKGFEGVIDEHKKLNAVVLGEENAEINRQINIIENEISVLEKQKSDIYKTISKPENGEENYWTKYEKSKQNTLAKKKEMEEFFIKAASDIKNMSNPQLAKPSYDKRALMVEIDKAKLLTPEKIEEYKKLLSIESKKAEPIMFLEIDFKDHLDFVNRILKTRVKEEVRIERIENDNRKRKFAEEGLKIHNANEVCSFCGNVISEEKLSELKGYFSADEVKKLQNEIEKNIGYLNKTIDVINIPQINTASFYPEFQVEVNLLKDEFDEEINSMKNFLQELIRVLEKKKGELFIESNSVEIEEPNGLGNIKLKYEDLVGRNNSIELEELQRIAKERLRYNEIKIKLDKFNYDTKNTEFKYLIEKEAEAKKEFECVQNSYYALNKEVIEKEEDIKTLLEKTISEELLAENINKKLKLLSSVELIHCDDGEEKGCYRIKCLRTGEIREVTQLSTGEKNIIAFLYFIEKLDEIESVPKEYDRRIIIFDDPMNSNDDTMQYLIIDELQKLIKKVKGEDRLIILTHNKHFYLNVKYGQKYKENRFIRLNSNGKTIQIELLNREEDDFRTSYENLWFELRFLYNSEAVGAELLLNPIRRIIETFLKFNKISKNKFYENQLGANKLFNVNSHSIDDFEAELNGKTKDEIIDIMKKCFNDNGFENHLKTFWEC